MHSVKDGKGKTHVHDDSPHAELIELSFSVMVKLRTSSKRRHDPQLWKTHTKGQYSVRLSLTVNLREQSTGTHNDVAQQQKGTDLPQHSLLPQPFGMFHRPTVVLRLCIGAFLHVDFFKVALFFA